MCHFKELHFGRLQPDFQKIWLGWKWLRMENTLAYDNMTLITDVKDAIVHALWLLLWNFSQP